ncbi:hypothetical protein PSA7680_00850 [Pseudoruegeria aquimaris]|uniref:DUF1858 domain-containing protein n=1 Tax=Pseudoruegeria aquimaris TaxID=393663 RepID=A0A1Y5RNZ4_9RHOB|nr:DUF1858 domain-containing protein [Pseudoruegeria aquimaris]SLN21982.1 hypothetical protein PSA7680_00850 [Pseudoruegeria aquimaris]
MRRRLHDPDLPLGELMDSFPATIPVFLKHRMLCVGCMVSPFHTVIDACAEYGLEEESFRAELTEAVRGADPAPAPRDREDQAR